MRNNNKAVRIIAIGLLLVTIPFLIKEFVPIPDFFRGLLMGVGIAFEAVGLLLMLKLRVKQN